MGIKYICDFCGTETTNYHEKLENGKIICSNCYSHLEKQTWRLAEEPMVYAKAKKELEEEARQLSLERKVFEKEKTVDNLLAKRIHNAFYAVLRLYNEMVITLDKTIPKGFLFKREDFKIIPETEIKKLENMAIDEILETVERNFYNNFDPYLDGFRISHSQLLDNLPTIPL